MYTHCHVQLLIHLATSHARIQSESTGQQVLCLWLCRKGSIHPYRLVMNIVGWEGGGGKWLDIDKEQIEC